MLKFETLQVLSALILLGLPVVFFFQNCGQRTQFTLGESSIVAGQNFCVTNPGDPVCTPIDVDGNNICYFNGVKYAVGDVVASYQNSAVPYGELCLEAFRTCEPGGRWSGLGSTYNYASCSVGGLADCLFDGLQIPHGQSVLAFQNASVPQGQKCNGEQNFCNNGVLSSTYKYSSCKEGDASDCFFNGKQVKHGEIIEAYRRVGETHSMPPHYICEAEKRQCLNGSLTGSFELDACNDNGAKSCEFNGRRVANGETVKAFETPVVKETEKDCKVEPRTCENGKLSGTYEYPSCNDGHGPKSCFFRGTEIADGETIVASKYEVITYEEWKNFRRCEYEKRTCRNGVLDGTFEFNTCERQTPPILPPNYGSDCVVTVSPQAGSKRLSFELTIPNNTTTEEKYYTTDKADDNPSKKCEAESITCTDGEASSKKEVFSGCIE